MPHTRAVLLDVYDTALACDFTAHGEVLPALAGVPQDTWQQESTRRMPLVMDGRLTLRQGFAEVMATAGVAPDPDVLDHLLAEDLRLLVAGARLYPDTVPFLRELRDRGIKTAFVSNCADNTRELLEHLGLAQESDALVLSCEVGASKPDAAIYWRALDTLEVRAEDALLVDDQESYCDGAVLTGLRAVRVMRDGAAPAGTVAGLHEVLPLL